MYPLIFITNDDGISAKGLKSLVEAAAEFGKSIVVAPDKPQSGMGHAITINQILRLEKSKQFDEVEAYMCSGTPVDCVKLGIYEVMKRKPDLILSGINHGANTSSTVLYSGTMSAAVEGAMENIPSIGFSLESFDSDADFSAAKEVVKTIIAQALNTPFPSNICLNVNIPSNTKGSIKGMKVCRQARAFWEDRFDKRVDNFGKEYYWLTGEFHNDDTAEDTDLFALKAGYVSIVPTQFDLTSYENITLFKPWEK
jgi:5'-nucleotidase